MQEYLTIEQVMDRLQLKRGAVSRLIKDETFPAYKIGGAVRIGSDELDNWIKKQRMNK